LKILLHYDKFKVQMKINGLAKIVGSLCILLAGSLLLAGCEIQPVAGRYTYIVKYEVSSVPIDPLFPPTDADIDYTDELGVAQNATGITPPWSLELPVMDYDYSNPFNPQMTFNSATFTNAGDKITAKIILKDYKTDFQEQVLESKEVTYNGSPTDSFTLAAPPLPLP
jgi:hypothetical protein